MKPGRELDALVAEKVLGCKLLRHPAYPGRVSCDCPATGDLEYPHGHDDACGPGSHSSLAPFSTDIAWAWKVVEHVEALHHIELHRQASDRWEALEASSCSPTGSCRPPRSGRRPTRWEALEACGDYIASWAADGVSAPHAICLAALKAVGVDIEKESADAVP